MSEIANLIARLEAAAEGSREMDEALGKIAGVIPEEATFAFWDPESGLAQYHWQEADGEGGSYLSGVAGPRYTREIDAALTLVDGEGFWRLGHDGAGPNPGDFFAEIWPARGATQRARHASAALALCIAALKARAA